MNDGTDYIVRRDSRADCVVRMEGRLAMTWYEQFLKSRLGEEQIDEETWYDHLSFNNECQDQEGSLELRKVEALERIADALDGLRAATWIK